MSQQLSVRSFFRKPSNCDVVDKHSEKRGIDALEDEGQASNTDIVYQIATANTTGQAIKCYAIKAVKKFKFK